jgi:hypothetical protein
MKRYPLSFLLILILHIAASAQHNLITVLNRTGTVASTQVSAGVSQMYEGTISNNYMRFRKLPVLKDGEIKYIVTQKIVNENIIVKLRADTALVQTFQLTLNNGTLTMEYPGKIMNVGTYKNGDFVKIVRCKNSILFYKNNNLIDGYTLPNNNFVMYGEVALTNTQASKANISFTPY